MRDSGVCQCLPHPAEVSGACDETEGKVALQHRRGDRAHLLSYAHIPEAERTRKWIRLGNCLRDIEIVHWRKKRRRRRRTTHNNPPLHNWTLSGFYPSSALFEPALTLRKRKRTEVHLVSQ